MARSNNDRVIRQLADIRAVIRSMATGQLRREVIGEMGAAALELSRAQLASQTQPSGQAWKPLAPGTVANVGARAPLAGIAQRLRTEQGDALFALVVPGRQTIWHNFGAHSRSGKAFVSKNGKLHQQKDGRWTLPIRRIFPKGKLPAKWAKSLDAAVHRAVLRVTGAPWKFKGA